MPPTNTVTFDLSKEIRKLEDQREKARNDADEVIARIIAENREFNADEQKRYDESKGSVVSIDKRIKLLRERIESNDDEGDSREQPRTREKNLRPGSEEEDAKRTEARQKLALRNWLVDGNQITSEDREALSPLSLRAQHMGEHRGLSSLVGSTGGYLVPTGTTKSIEIAMKQFIAVEQAGAEVLTTSTGEDFPYPTMDDTSNEGEQVPEGAVTNTGPDPTLKTVMMRAFMFSSKPIYIPIQLLQDSIVDIEQLLTNALSERLGRATSRKFTLGTGAGEPQGVVTAASVGVTAASATAITFEETIDLQHTVDPAYRPLARYMFNDQTLKAVRKLKDGDGRPIWQPQASSGLAAGIPSTLNGDAYAINTYMDTLGSGKRSMLYGTFDRYKIRRVRGIALTRLVETKATSFQIGILAFARVDGRHVDAGQNAIKCLVHP